MNQQLECLKTETLSQYLQGQLAGEDDERVEAHLAACGYCLEMISTIAERDPFYRTVATSAGVDEKLIVSSEQIGAMKAKLEAIRPEKKRPADELPCPLSNPDLFATVAGPVSPPSNGVLGQLGIYRLMEELGRGGMGVVYRAQDTVLNREVAIKAMLPKYANDENAKQRFLREARSIAAIAHRNIVPIHHVVEEGGVPFIVMPLLIGQSLHDRLVKQPPLATAEAVRIGREIALGLAAAHAKGVIHRDIKPSNIWLEDGPEGGVRILDFGLARQDYVVSDPGDPKTQTGMVLGTPEYISPEQACAKTADARSDLYSLGVVLYRLVGKQLPFIADSPTGYLMAHAKEMPRDVRELIPAISPLLASTIMQLLEKDPSRRPASAQDLAEALERYFQPEEASTVSFLGASKNRTGSRNRLALLVGGALVVALLVGFVAWLNRDRLMGTSPSDDLKPIAKGNTPITDPKPIVNPPVRIKALRVSHFVRVKDGDEERSEDRGLIGEKTLEVKFNDAVKINLELTAPAYAYLISFNADGSEQVLWPVGPDRKPSETVRPPWQDYVKYPARPGKEFGLDDDPSGGLQAFAAVISLEPLPPYAEWKKSRGDAAWKKLPPGHGVWASDGDGVYPVTTGQLVRGKERDVPNAPPLAELCLSLQRGGRGLQVEALAFPVRAKE